MRIALSLALLFAFGGCADDLQVGADALWQVRCSRGVPGCSMSGEAVNVLDFNGANGVSVNCSVMDLPGGVNRLFNVEIVAGPSQRLQVENLTIGTSGAIAGTGTVRITDGDRDLNGDVRGTEPTEDVPCRITPIEFLERAEGPAMSFELECREIRNPAAPDATRRDLTFPDDPSRAAAISVFNCPGL